MVVGQTEGSGGEYRAPEATISWEQRFWQFSQDVAGTLLRPVDTLRDIGRREAIISALVLVVLFAGISVVAQAASLALSVVGAPGFDSPAMPFAAQPVAATQMAGILWSLVWAPVAWTLMAVALYVAAYFLGGRGKFASVWAATGFALTPQLLVAPLTAVNEVLGVLGAGWQLFGWILLLPVTIGAFIWSVVLSVIAVRETMGLSTGRAIGSVAILFAVILMIVVLIVCLIALMFVVLGLAATS